MSSFRSPWLAIRSAQRYFVVWVGEGSMESLNVARKKVTAGDERLATLARNRDAGPSHTEPWSTRRLTSLSALH